MAVNLRRDLNEHSCARDSEQRAPEILHRMLCVDMADITESERDSSYGNGNREERGRDRPAQTLRPIEKLLSGRDIPANLKMHGERADEDPDGH